MYKLLKYVESEMKFSSFAWSAEFDSFLTSFMLSAFDDFVASLSFIGGCSHV